jgi:hypothetical protein
MSVTRLSRKNLRRVLVSDPVSAYIFVDFVTGVCKSPVSLHLMVVVTTISLEKLPWIALHLLRGPAQALYGPVKASGGDSSHYIGVGVPQEVGEIYRRVRSSQVIKQPHRDGEAVDSVVC